MNHCSICTHSEQTTLEEFGLEALHGKRSWRDAARAAGLSHAQGLKNHMERHYEEKDLDAELQEALDPLVTEAIEELTAQMRVAPAEVKPFYLVAIANLKKLHETKPSQQHLLNALKGIHEVTGMKMEQRLMLEFAKHHFGLGSGEAAAAIEQHTDVIDVEELAS